VRSSFKWSVVSAILKQALSLIRSIVMARLLSQHDFGLFGMANTVTTAFALLTNVGMQHSIIVQEFQDDRGRAAYLNTVWTFEILRRLALSLLIVAISYPAALFYKQQQVTFVIMALALTPVIEGFQNIGMALYRKEVRFNRLVFFDAAQAVLSTVVVCFLALYVRNVWALVYGQLLTSVLSVVISYLLHPFRPRLGFDKRAYRSAFQFGKFILVINLATYITTTADNVVVGRLLGTAPLGAYVIAYSIANLPVLIVTQSLGSVLYPAYAELAAGDPNRLRQAITRVVTLGITINLAISMPLFVIPEQLVVLLYGAKWREAGQVLGVLALIGLLRGLTHLVSPLLIGLKRPDLDAKAKIAETIFFLVTIYPCTLYYGLYGAAWCGVVCYTAAFLQRYYFANRLVPISRQVRRTFCIALLAAPMVIWLSRMLMERLSVVLAQLLLGITLPSAALLAVMILFSPVLRREARSLRRAPQTT
jgi:O-antigen/teichoic acid export membrane protein